MIYLGNILQTSSTSETNKKTIEASESVVKTGEFFPIHTPAGAFLSALYHQGMIDSNYRIVKDKFITAPYPPLVESQIKALETLFKNKKFQVSFDSNIYISNVSQEIKASCEFTLDELNIHLRQFASESFGIILSPPILIGGYLRFIILSSLEYCQSAFESAGLSNVKDVITQQLVDAARRNPPDADVKYMVPQKTPKAPLKSKDNLYEFTDEVVKFIAKKMNNQKTVFSDWSLAKNSLAHYFVVPLLEKPQVQATENNREINQIKDLQSKTASKIQRFGLVSFPKSLSFKIDVVFDKIDEENSNPHEDQIYNLAINLCTHRLISPDMEYWQGLIDMLGLVVHFRNPELCKLIEWSLLLSYYLRGYVCSNKTDPEIIWKNAKDSPESLSECLKKCWVNHHAKDPYAAIVLTFQACLFLDNDTDRVKLWKEMSMHWNNFLKAEKDSNLLSMIDQEIRFKMSSFEEVVAMLQALSLFDLLSSSHPLFKADIKKCGNEPLLQIKVEKLNYHLLLPWKFENSFKLLTEVNSSFFNEIYQKKGVTSDFGSFLLNYKPFLAISWEALHEQAHALLNQPNELKQSIGYHLLLNCQHFHPKPETWPKLYSHLPNYFKSSLPQANLESCFLQLHTLIMGAKDNSCPSFYPSTQFIKEWLIHLASKDIVQARAACELWKHFFLISENASKKDLEILDVLAIHHPVCIEDLTDAILKNNLLDFDTRYYAFEHLLKAHTPSDPVSFERVLTHAKSFTTIKPPNPRSHLFDTAWKNFFQQLNHQKRGPEAAELLCALAKNEFFNPDNQDLDSLWLETCHGMLLASTLELTGKLAANIYKQRLWDKGWNNEGHIKLLYKLSKAFFKHNEGLSNLCLKFACREAKKGSSHYTKICGYVVSHLKDQIITHKISELEALAKNPFKEHIPTQDYVVLSNQVKVMAIQNEFTAHKFEAGDFLLKQLDKDTLTQEQQDQITQIQLQAMTRSFAEANYEHAKIILKQLMMTSFATERHFKEIQDRLLGQFKSKEGVFFIGKMLLNPIYFPLFMHGENTFFEWQFKCLETIYKVYKSEKKSAPFIQGLLILLLKGLKESDTLPKESFFNGVELLNTILNDWRVDALVPDELKKQIECSTESILSRLKKDSQYQALHRLVQLIQQKIKHIELSKKSTENYLWSLQLITSSPEPIGEFLLSSYFPEHLNLVITTIGLLVKDQSLSLALDLLKKYEINTNSLWKTILQHIEASKDDRLQAKCWDALQNYAEKKQLLSAEERVHCWCSAINALINSQSRKILTVLDNLKQLDEVFFNHKETKLTIYKNLVLGGLKHITNAQTQTTQVNVIAALDSFLIDRPFTLEESLSVIKKLSTSSNPEVLQHVCYRLLKHLQTIGNKQDQFPTNANAILTRLIKVGVSEESYKPLREGIKEIFNHIQLTSNKHLDLLTLIRSSIKKNDNRSDELVWSLVNQFLSNETDEPQAKISASQQEKCSVIMLTIFQELLSSSYQATIVHLFLNINYGATCMLTKDLMIIRSECLKLSLDKALKIKSPDLKLKLLNLFFDLAKNRKLSSEHLLSCFSEAIDLAIEVSGITGIVLPFLNIYSKMIGSLFEIYDDLADFYKVFSLAAKKAKTSNKNVLQHFIRINTLVFEKIIRLNRYSFSLIFPTNHFIEPHLPYDSLVIICGLVQTYLSTYHIHEIDAQFFPLLPRYYFQRMFLSSDKSPLSESEFKVFANKHTMLGVSKYEVEILEIKTMIQNPGSSYEISSNHIYKQAAERVNNSDQLQIVLAYLGKMNFNNHRLSFFELHTLLLSTLKKDPFFVCEIDMQSLCFLFLKNIEKCLQEFDPSSINSPDAIDAHKSVITMLFKITEGFIELFDTYTLDEQYLHLNPVTNFLNLACCMPGFGLKYHIFDVEGLNINKSYFRLAEKIFRADIKKRKKDAQTHIKFPEADIFELICCDYPGVDKHMRVKTFCLWIEEISKFDSLKDPIAKCIKKADAKGIFEGFPEYRERF